MSSDLRSTLTSAAGSPAQGPVIEARALSFAFGQGELRRQVLSLIAEHYPHLKIECEYQLFLNETGLKKRRTQ